MRLAAQLVNLVRQLGNRLLINEKSDMFHDQNGCRGKNWFF